MTDPLRDIAPAGWSRPRGAENEKGPREGAFGHRAIENEADAYCRRSSVVAVSGNELDAPSGR